MANRQGTRDACGVSSVHAVVTSAWTSRFMKACTAGLGDEQTPANRSREPRLMHKAWWALARAGAAAPTARPDSGQHTGRRTARALESKSAGITLECAGREEGEPAPNESEAGKCDHAGQSLEPGQRWMRQKQASGGVEARSSAVACSLHGCCAMVCAQPAATCGQQALVRRGSGEGRHQQPGGEGEQQPCAELVHVPSVPHRAACGLEKRRAKRSCRAIGPGLHLSLFSHRSRRAARIYF